jgi:S-layer protein
MTLGGLTFTSGAAGTTTQQLAAAFSNLSSGVTGASLNASGQSAFGSFSGTFTGWNTAIVGANSTLVTFTSTTPNLDVTNLSAAVSGAAPSIATVQGRTAGTESTVATFSALAAGQTLSLGGLSYTATVAHTAAEVAQAFAGLAAGAAPTQAVETSSVTFSAMVASDSITLGGLTIAATGNVAANDVAIAFASGGTTLAAGLTTSGSLTGFTGANIGSGVSKFRATSFGQVTDLSRTINGATTATATITTVGGDVGSGTGTYSGTLSGWHSAAATNNASTLTFTSNTLASDVSDLSLTASVPNAPVVSTINQGSAAATESALVTFSAMTAGQTLTLAGLTFTAGVGGSTAAEVASYFSTNGGGTNGAAGAKGTGMMTGTRAGWTSTAAAAQWCAPLHGTTTCALMGMRRAT